MLDLAKIHISLKERKKAIHDVSNIRDKFDSLYHNLYKVLEAKVINENVYRYRIAIEEDCEILKVHFPSQPIIPGSCILDIAKELIEDFQNQEMILREVNNIRFRTLLSPATDPVIDFYFEKEELPVDEDLNESMIDSFYRVFLVLRRKDTLLEEGMLAEMHLVLESRDNRVM